MNKSAAFTPGPWGISRPLCSYIGVETSIASGCQTAAANVTRCSVTNTIRRDEAEANARLIAAAPDLYEAARLFVEEYDAATDDDGVAMMLAYNAALEAAKAALAKARGTQ